MTDNDLSSFALLLVDVQKDFWPEKLANLYPDFPENVSKLLSLCRDNGIDIIHLRASFKADMSDWMPRYRIRKHIPCIEGTEGSEVLPFAKELPGEKIFTKQTFDGFHNPSLIPYLQNQSLAWLLQPVYCSRHPQQLNWDFYQRSLVIVVRMSQLFIAPF